MCLSKEERAVLDELDAEDQALREGGARLGHGGSLPYEVRVHHANLAVNRSRSPEDARAFEEHREAHRAEALRLRAERTK